jgi:predicted ATPase
MIDLFIDEIGLKPHMEPDHTRYPFSLPVVRHLQRLKLAPVTFFAGENGSGKSTLLEAIAVNFGFNPEGGTRNFNFSTRASHSELSHALRLVKGYRRPGDGFFLRAESFFNLATEIENLDRSGGSGPSIISSYGGVSLHEQSHGESFFTLFTKRFSGDGLYILDEPEAALSPMRQLALLARMGELVRLRSQFIIATHAPMLMAYPGARIYILSEDAIRETPYCETEHYQLTKQFLNNPERMLRILLEE